jgi:methylated-DNA-[protein]-cysteine S-methyltransferase
MRYSLLETPIGALVLSGSADGTLSSLDFVDGRGAPQPDGSWVRDDAAFAEARAQLGAYFDGRLRQFDLPLAPAGTAFQRSVWQALEQIPYGQTRTYGQLAAELGSPRAMRAVGAANGRNPISIVIPCHRLVGSDGSLTGYGGGLARKQWLLELEGAR